MGRRILFFAGLVLAWLAFMMGRAHAHMVTIYEPRESPRTVTFECPVGDGSDWWLDPAQARADNVDVIYASAQYFRAMCGAEVPNIVACASQATVDTLHGGYYSRIYVRAPFYTLPASVQTHELCHTQGWMHGRHYDLSFPSWRH